MINQFSNIVRLKAFNDWVTHHSNHDDEYWSRDRNRNRLHRELNTEYGYVEEYGLTGTGKYSEGDKVYAKKYDEIEKEFRDWYYPTVDESTNWRESYGWTVYEYLFFQDLNYLDEEGKNNLLAKANLSDFGGSAGVSEIHGDKWINNSIYLHAYHTIEVTKNSHEVLPHHINRTFTDKIENIILGKSDILHERTFFDVRFWEVRKINFIKAYNKKYVTEIRQQLNARLNQTIGAK